MLKGPRLWSLCDPSNLISHSSGQCEDEKNEHDQTQATARVVPPTPAVRPRGECANQQKDQEHNKNRRHEQPPCGFASTVVTDKLSENHGSASRVDVVYLSKKSHARDLQTEASSLCRLTFHKRDARSGRRFLFPLLPPPCKTGCSTSLLPASCTSRVDVRTSWIPLPLFLLIQII